MWADAQRDGRPTEYRWRPLRKFRVFLVPSHKVWLTADARVPCSNAANIGERKTGTQSEFAEKSSWKNPLRSKSPQKCIYSVPAQQAAKHRARLC